MFASMGDKRRGISVIALNTLVEDFLADYRVRVYLGALMHCWAVVMSNSIYILNHKGRAMKTGGVFPVLLLKAEVIQMSSV